MCRYGRVASHISNGRLCLYECRLIVDDEAMEISQHIYQHTCHKCDRPALTFNEGGDPLCGRHATIFIAMPRVETKDDEHLISVFAEASI
jgi:hypothetical protein